MIDIKEVYDQITEQHYTWCRVIKGKRQVLLITNRGGHENTADDCKKKLKAYLDKNPGEYAIQLKVKPNDPERSSIYFDDVSAGIIVDVTQAQLHAPLNEDKLKKKLRAEILAEMKEQNRREEIRRKELEIEKEHEMLQTFAGRLQAFGKIIFASLQQQPTGNLQGTMTTENDPIELKLSNDATDPKDLTQERKDLANKSLYILLHGMSPETLYRFALKVHHSPEVVNTLKALL